MYSEGLSRKVAVKDWKEAHAELVDEELQAGFENDHDLDESRLELYHFFVHEVKSLQCFALYVASLLSGAAMSCRRRE